ncbi:MAG: ribosomal protein S18-alanine N-acetyltransferase [Acetobacteraceae bacterium]|jgi:ribosomal-protein-alanine N-acetyltransferase
MAPEPLTGEIENATWGHAGIMAEIHRTAFPATEAWSRDVMLLQLGLPAAFGLVYSCTGMILGRVAADEAEILTLAVEPGQRRRGVGSALLRAAMARAASLGAASIFLEVAVTNDAARALYAAHGFTEAGLRRHYYTDGTDALILRSTLSTWAADS